MEPETAHVHIPRKLGYLDRIPPSAFLTAYLDGTATTALIPHIMRDNDSARELRAAEILFVAFGIEL